MEPLKELPEGEVKSNSNLKEMAKEVVADKVLKRGMANYVTNSKRKFLGITEFDGKLDYGTSTNVAKELENNPECIKMLKALFGRTEDEDPEENILTNCKEEGENNKEVELPKLFAPFKNKNRGWNKEGVQDQATLYLNILGYGKGGEKSFVNTGSKKKAQKENWWPDSVSFSKFAHPSKASMEANEDII